MCSAFRAAGKPCATLPAPAQGLKPASFAGPATQSPVSVGSACLGRAPTYAAAMVLPIVHHPDYDAKLPPTHRFPMSKYPLLIEALERRGMGAGLVRVPAPAATGWLEAVHDAAYVGQVLACRVEPS